MDAESALREVSRLFAGQFLGELWSAMRKTVPESEFGHGGAGERMFRDLADREAAMQVAYGGEFGLAELVYQSLSRRGAVRPAQATGGDA
jgi:Rod binding domain-containing protein